MASGASGDFLQVTSRYRLVLLFTLFAIAILLLPLQHYFTLARYQHYACGFASFGLGFIVQAWFSWPQLPSWGRISYLVTGVVYVLLAFVFWCNPWLDMKMSVQTEERDMFRQQLLVDYLISTLVITVCWMKWWAQDKQIKDERTSVSATSTREEG